MKYKKELLSIDLIQKRFILFKISTNEYIIKIKDLEFSQDREIIFKDLEQGKNFLNEQIDVYLDFCKWS